MKTTTTIPEKVGINQEILSITYIEQDPKIFRTVVGNDGVQTAVPVDVSDLWNTLTATQQTVIRKWFKEVGVLAVNKLNEAHGVIKTAVDFEGEFDDVEEEVDPIP
jgi:hypothetical protein